MDDFDKLKAQKDKLSVRDAIEVLRAAGVGPATLAALERFAVAYERKQSGR